MKITVLQTELGGTGGGINCIAIVNKFVQEGHWVQVFAGSLPPAEIRQTCLAPINPLSDVHEGLVADAVIAFNMTSTLQPIFMQLKGRKFFRFGLMHPEYEPLIADKSVTKIATTSYGKVFVEQKHAGQNIVAIPGPTNPVDFYPENISRSDIVLTYIKKSGWVAVHAINNLQDALPHIVFASLGDDGVPSLPIQSRYPIAILGAPAHLRSHLRYCYNRAGVFVDTHSTGPWGWNCCVGEAMLCGCPVVCTDSPEFSDLIYDGETALAVRCDGAPEIPNGDWMTRPHPDEIVGRMKEMLENADLRARLTKNALGVARWFDVHNWYKGFMQLW